MLRHPEETQRATTGAWIELPHVSGGVERWTCWPDRGFEMFVIIERPDGSMVAFFKPGHWLPIREGRWKTT
jgi:hypothetical protein